MTGKVEMPDTNLLFRKQQAKERYRLNRTPIFSLRLAPIEMIISEGLQKDRLA